MRPMLRRHGKVRVKCLGLNCPLGGYFLSDDATGHRFCPECDRLRVQNSQRHCQLVAIRKPEGLPTGCWDEG